MHRLLKTLQYIFLHEFGGLPGIFRFLRWQVGTRILGDVEVVFPWTVESRLLAKRGVHAATLNFYCRYAEPVEMLSVLRLLHPEDTFLDVGANIGSYTVLVATAKQCAVHAFEPVPSTFTRLQDNVLLNRLEPYVELHNYGLSDTDGYISFTTHEDSTNHVVSVAGGPADTSLRVRCLDSAIELTGPTFMKIDVEGWEYHVLRGAQKTLQNSMLWGLILELNGSGERNGVSDDEILRMLSAHGFVPATWNRESDTLILGQRTFGQNALFVRNQVLLSERIRLIDLT